MYLGLQPSARSVLAAPGGRSDAAAAPACRASPSATLAHRALSYASRQLVFNVLASAFKNMYNYLSNNRSHTNISHRILTQL